ncbi:YajG family lipoprotein [Nitrospirillum sp. BR 11828]|uniref:YajG family lipoprotein n=1 Tax=Nitrospirillum sp. BR 11828 TaxID=3104325 RepID=UPI002ACA6E68|nr:YajG family lipoprotein [Nitrospirillum sp. BR 11828]MDZ5646202.1 YajG family lipoprotein [Nitrospirillum sp. BR 11828]
MIRVFAGLIAISMLAGCALSEDVATVKYVPTKAEVVADAKPVGLTVVDARTSDRNRISAKINGFGTEMAAIRSDKDVPTIVTDAFKTELEARGFHVQAGGRPITVSINQFYNQYGAGVFSGTATADVNLTVAVGNGAGAPAFSQTYAGTAKKTILMANGSNAAETVASALNDALAKMFADPAFVATLTGKSSPVVATPAVAGSPTS